MYHSNKAISIQRLTRTICQQSPQINTKEMITKEIPSCQQFAMTETLSMASCECHPLYLQLKTFLQAHRGYPENKSHLRGEAGKLHLCHLILISVTLETERRNMKETRLSTKYTDIESSFLFFHNMQSKQNKVPETI